MAKELGQKLLKQAMNLDLYYMVKDLIKYNTKDDVLLILKNLGTKADSQNSSAGSKKPYASMIHGARSFNQSTLYDASTRAHKQIS